MLYRITQNLLVTLKPVFLYNFPAGLFSAVRMNQALCNPFDLISKGTGLKDFPITTACRLT